MTVRRLLAAASRVLSLLPAALLAQSLAAAVLAQPSADRAAVGDLIERPAGFVAMPRPKPGIVETFANGCTVPDPEIQWARLPRPLREVPLREMIGQLLVVSFSGKTADSPGVVATRAALARSEIGGVLYFRFNIGSADDVRAVNRSFAEAHDSLPAFIAIDQEGGAVTRLKPSEGAPRTPSAAEIAAASPEAAEAAYAAMAANLADLGFTVNFGPVVDLAVNPDNPVIARYGRSYGADPAKVVQLAKTFIAEHAEAGVATVLKHFPGHGSSTADSHDGAIDLTPTWSRRELIPFRDLIADGSANMVMAGHLTLDGLTGPGGLPASLSPRAIGTFLRETLCFDGLVVSDDLAMDAIGAEWPPAEAVALMIEAGGDIALLSLPAGEGMDDIARLVDDLAARATADPRFARRVRYAYARVVNHKLDLQKRRVSTGDPAANRPRVAETQ